jgi:hypothetical protein
LPLDIKAFRAARLDIKLHQLALGVLRKLCGRIGHLPDSYLLSAKFDLSGITYAAGGFAIIQIGVFEGKSVAIKTLRASETDKAKIRKVGKQVSFSHPGSLTHRIALL